MMVEVGWAGSQRRTSPSWDELVWYQKGGEGGEGWLAGADGKEVVILLLAKRFHSFGMVRQSSKNLCLLGLKRLCLRLEILDDLIELGILQHGERRA